MIKVRQYTLRPSPEQAELLRDTQREAASCWGDIVDIAKEHYKSTGGKWISKGDLQKLLKGRYRLHSQTIQGLTDKFAANRQTAAEKRRQGDKHARYPWRKKKYSTVPFKQHAISRTDSGSIRLALSKGVHLNTGVRPNYQVHTAEVLWRRGRYILALSGEFPEREPRDEGLSAGCDIGEIHPAAVCAEDGSGLVVSGREIRSAKQYRNRMAARLDRMISRCREGSRRHKRLLRVKGRLMAKTEDRVRDMAHKATRRAIDWCSEKGIRELVIGDLDGVEKNTRKKRRLSRKSAQKVSQMEHGRITRYLGYKAREAGISACLANERGTSKKCPHCGRKNHTRGRLYQCADCGLTAHRDGKAGFLILQKARPELPVPSAFAMQHVQSVPKYRKGAAGSRPACVDGADVAPSRPVNSPAPA